MRPLSLTMSGFRSHMETTELSFEERTLTAIVGPTGSGKSSILEAISYALYAKTPREQRALKRLICSRCDVARVEFRFLIDEREYLVTRVLRRSGTGQHIIEDLSSGDKLSGEAVVSNRVIELLGLGFDAFSSSVLLAQGQFAKFLQATPKDRGVILKGIFRLDQIDELQKAAKARRDALEDDLKLIEGERNAIPTDVAERLKRARAEEKDASTRAAALEKAIPREKTLLKDLSDIERKRGELDLSIKRVTKIIARLPDDAQLHDLGVEREEFKSVQEAATKAWRTAADAHTAALSKHAELENALGTEVALIEARGHVRARDEAATKIEQSQKQRREAAVAKEAADATVALTQQQLSQADEALLVARDKESALLRMHSAHELRGTLAAGEPCPVCEQIVTAVPEDRPPAELGEIATRVKQAVAAQASASAAERAAAFELERLKAALETSSVSLAALETERQRSERELATVLGDPSAPMAELEARLVQVRESAALVAATRDAATTEQERVDKLRQAAAALDKRHLDARTRLIELFGQADMPAPEMDPAAGSLVEHAATLRTELTSKIDEARVAAMSLETDLAGTTQQLEQLRAELELPSGATIETVFADARSTAEVARNEAATAEKQLARSKELKKEEQEVKARRGLFKVLTTDLTAQQFIAFLLEERTRLLLELGSERLHTMTGNRYRLELDEKNDLEVVDELDADKRRSVDTLSGGETFLASLALAIALAEVVTRAGGRLQCFFLDEGFGSLDPESFDLAMDGIERIVAEGRLIGLVSHVPALRDRVEDQIVLEKGEDGMSRIAAGGSR
jgi:DNA repair protein SbcC/Rad50